MNDSFVFISPCGVSKDALDGAVGLKHRTLFMDGAGESMRNLIAALNHVFREVIEDLCPGVGGGPSPSCRRARCRGRENV